ncbi:MAG: hypothetical protein KR126chlam6_00607 [Candidatus Anoxychlamydiales bacterium]|nr:hypothetical protein [Candidatus Anoxychlamydiales bacterium]
MGTISMSASEKTQWNLFNDDIDLIEQSLSAFKKGKILQWSSQSHPIKVLTEGSAMNYIKLCKMTRTDSFSPYALKWSENLAGKIDAKAVISVDFLQKLNAVKEAFKCLSQTFEKYAEENPVFNDAAKNYQQASDTIEAICQTHEESGEITDASIWELQERLEDSQACAKEVQGEPEETFPPLPKKEIKIFPMEL